MGLTVKGIPINPIQQNQANILLDTAASLQVGQICAQALICAAIGESNMTNLAQANSDGYWGVLQGGSGYGKSSANFPPPNGWNDTVGMTTAFLQGGKGFGNGWAAAGYPQLSGQGAIAGVRAGVSDPGLIATACEDSGSPASVYGQWLSEAQAIIAAHGGATATPRGGVAGAVGGTANAIAGTAGAISGGTGTIPDGSPSSTYAFSIGASNNPSEDVWTGINRLAQEVNWYLFSNGEHLYYMDGAEMSAQTPAMYLDRVADGDQILSARGSFDNTAFGYVSNHLRKFRVQRQTKLMTVTSPTEVDMEIVCGIDELRAGDVIVLSSFGVLDGRWIVGTCQRSVFSVSSSIRLVPPIAPISEAAVVGTTGRRASASSPANLLSGGAPGTPGGRVNPQSTGGYINPLGRLTVGPRPGRIDMGVDYSGSGPVVAIGDGKITAITNSGWPGGAFIEIALSSGAYAGKFWYCAENITPTVTAGQIVKAGDQIGTLHDASPNCEIGWGAGTGGGTLAASLGQAGINSGHANCAAGQSADRFMQSLGAPACSAEGFNVAGTMPAGYP